YFSAAELARLDACSAQAGALFFRYWTLKEAYLKATGAGLAGLLRALGVLWGAGASGAGNHWLARGIGFPGVDSPPRSAAAGAAGLCRGCRRRWVPMARLGRTVAFQRKYFFADAREDGFRAAYRRVILGKRPNYRAASAMTRQCLM